jgi:hypothetical protein
MKRYRRSVYSALSSRPLFQMIIRDGQFPSAYSAVQAVQG